jgi:hypothetical protein
VTNFYDNLYRLRHDAIRGHVTPSVYHLTSVINNTNMVVMHTPEVKAKLGKFNVLPSDVVRDFRKICNIYSNHYPVERKRINLADAKCILMFIAPFHHITNEPLKLCLWNFVRILIYLWLAEMPGVARAGLRPTLASIVPSLQLSHSGPQPPLYSIRTDPNEKTSSLLFPGRCQETSNSVNTFPLQRLGKHVNVATGR